MEDLNICVNKGCSGYSDSNCKAVILFEACKDKQPLATKTEPVAKLHCSDGLCKPPVNAIKAALWWMDAGLKDADMNKGEYELTRGYKEELEEYLTRLA